VQGLIRAIDPSFLLAQKVFFNVVNDADSWNFQTVEGVNDRTLRERGHHVAKRGLWDTRQIGVEQLHIEVACDTAPTSLRQPEQSHVDHMGHAA
jgi:hypothetical protein